jgi:hypothetical protein
VTGWVLANQKPFCNVDPRLDIPPSLLKDTSSYRTLAAYPIVKDALLHGVVTLYSLTLAEYDLHHQRLLSEAVTIVAVELSAACAVHPS